MNQSNKKGFAALYDLQERKKQAKSESPPLPTSHHDSPPLPSEILPHQPVTTTPHQSPPLPNNVEQKSSAQETRLSPAPARDFNRRANSIERDALPQGLFPGSSKKIYDALYLRSRGAHPPRTSVRASRRDFLDWTDIRNLKTVDGHLRYLMSVGLIIRYWELGSTEGSEYEVRLPEELPRLPTSPHQSPRDTATHLSSSGYSQYLGSGGDSQSIDSQWVSEDGKTYIKTKDINTDDEAFAEFAATVRKTAKEITGKELSKSEAARWAEVAEVLMTELRIAAGRTTISSVPAFLAEHLRRRLWKKEKRQIEAEVAGQKASASERKVDSSKCPDCFGAGMYYPEGFDKGVVRCHHLKLLTES
jgi:hypothetical protein